MTAIWVQGEAENHRAIISYNNAVIGGCLEGNQIYLHITESKNIENLNVKPPLNPELILNPKLVVNSAGLSALALAKRFVGLNRGNIPSAYYARGCYFALTNAKVPPFKHLIYPIPGDGGLGVHVTLDLNGQVKFGPDVEWIDGVDDISSFLNRYFFIISLYHSILQESFMSLYSTLLLKVKTFSSCETRTLILPLKW